MKELGGLRLKPTLERLITDGRTYDFTNLMIKSRGALEYQKSFFKPPDLDPTDLQFDAKHEQVLASVQALSQEIAASRERKQARSRRMYQEEQDLPAANLHEQATSQGPLGEAGPTESWRERQERRQAQFKPTPTTDGNAERRDARRKAERGREMDRRRDEGRYDNHPSQYNMARDDSPLVARNELQSKYDKRYLKSRKTPLLTRATSAQDSFARSSATRSGQRDATLQLRRESLAQQNNKRQRQPDVPTRLRKRKVDDPLPGRRRGDVGPIATTPRTAT